jgi:hypothetical protein
MKMAVFWVVAPCNLVEVYRRLRGACCLHNQGNSFYKTTQCNDPEDSHLHTRRHENLKSHILQMCSLYFAYFIKFVFHLLQVYIYIANLISGADTFYWNVDCFLNTHIIEKIFQIDVTDLDYIYTVRHIGL